MLTLRTTITCNLPDKEEVLDCLEEAHKNQHFKNEDDVYDEIEDAISTYTDDEIFNFFWEDIDEYVNDIKNTFLDAHPEIKRWY